MLLGETSDMAREGHDTSIRGDTDMGGGNARCPAQFGKNGLLKMAILGHDILQSDRQKGILRVSVNGPMIYLHSACDRPARMAKMD